MVGPFREVPFREVSQSGIAVMEPGQGPSASKSGGIETRMASAELNSQPPPIFWTHLMTWFRSIPRAALLSMVGPSLLCVVGYLGWRYYGAPNLDLAYYGLKQDNIHLSPPQPAWLRKTNVLEEVFQGGSLANLSLLDGQTPVKLARVFDAHPCVRKTHRVEKMAGGQVVVNLEYRTPVALVCLPTSDEKGIAKDGFFAVDSDAVLLDTKNFSNEDVLNYILIYPSQDEKSSIHRTTGKPFGDVRVKAAVDLCTLLQRYREAIKITRVYVYPAPTSRKSSWLLEIETASGPRIEWGSAPGMEGIDEADINTKLNRLMSIAKDSRLWSQSSISLAERIPPTSQK